MPATSTRREREGVGLAPSAAEFRTPVPRSKDAQQETCILCGELLELSCERLVDTRFGTPGSWEIRRCGRCGLERTMPALSLPELKKLYEGHYNFGGETGTRYTRWRERFLFSFLYRMWNRLDGDMCFHLRSGRGRLLDVGCNEGRGLRMYAANGFQPEGVELNETAAGVARKAGFRVHTCFLEELQSLARYEIAVLTNVLEHSPDPRKMLSELHRLLAGKGQIWITCPNSESWQRTLFGRSWINWHVPFHVFHFSSQNLRQLLAETGFTKVRVRQISPALWAAQSLIAFCFAKGGKKTHQLRSPLLTVALLVFVRGVLFPLLWLGNTLGRGDCLLATACKD